MQREEDNKELQVHLTKVEKDLENETLSKVDLQNQNQSLREELAFKKKVYDEVCRDGLLAINVCCDCTN